MSSAALTPKNNTCLLTGKYQWPVFRRGRCVYRKGWVDGKMGKRQGQVKWGVQGPLGMAGRLV